MFHAGMTPALANRDIQRIIVGHGTEQIAVALTETIGRFLGQLHFRDRHQIQRLALANGDLGQGIEQADAFQAVAEEIQAQRCFSTSGIDINNAATSSEFARLHHRAGAAVTIADQEIQQLHHLDPGTGPGLEYRALD